MADFSGGGIIYDPQSDITGVIYKCHFCTYTGTSKYEFNCHMETHFDHKCPYCDYASRTEGRLKRHVRDFHSDTPPASWAGVSSTKSKSNKNRSSTGGTTTDDTAMDSDDSKQGSDGEQGPEVANCLAHGGPVRKRKFKCKQCGFVTMEQVQFWQHIEQHMKPDKILKCPNCPFVTEYKHHLEYHQNKRAQSKPFKCEKCNYSCVNKSMLNSHLKSHSNIYQYRCADCSYATKYCHSLKLHLRKKGHKPAEVLNLDGTPNPYPIIDVYGTRRGPRPKRNKNGQIIPPDPKELKKRRERGDIRAKRLARRSASAQMVPSNETNGHRSSPITRTSESVEERESGYPSHSEASSSSTATYLDVSPMRTSIQSPRLSDRASPSPNEELTMGLDLTTKAIRPPSSVGSGPHISESTSSFESAASCDGSVPSSIESNGSGLQYGTSTPLGSSLVAEAAKMYLYSSLMNMYGSAMQSQDETGTPSQPHQFPLHLLSSLANLSSSLPPSSLSSMFPALNPLQMLQSLCLNAGSMGIAGGNLNGLYSGLNLNSLTALNSLNGIPGLSSNLTQNPNNLPWNLNQQW